MGKGGIDPFYFLYKMSFTEIILTLEGIEMRDLPGWRQMRLLAVNILTGIGAKKEDGSRIAPSDIVQLPEDTEISEADDYDDDEVMRLIADCEAYNRSLSSTAE